MFFTQEDYKKILTWLNLNAIKDSEFKEASLPLNEYDIISFVLNGNNVKVRLKDFINELFQLGVSDFLNITEKYNERNITIEQAIKLIPSRARKKGLIITFLNTDNRWVIYQFKGELNLWNILELWDNIFDINKYIVNSILPDEEDLTMSLSDSKSNSYLSLKDKQYNPEEFSGLGRVRLRKNTVEEYSTEFGKIKKNILVLDMINKPNTIYEIQYDFDLNNLEIIIPEGCVLDFKGGSLSNGIINGNSFYIFGYKYNIFNKVKLIGNCINDYFYAEWFGLSVKNEDNSDIFNLMMDYNKLNIYGSRPRIIKFGSGYWKFKKTIYPIGLELVGTISQIAYAYDNNIKDFIDSKKTVFQFIPTNKGKSIELNNDFENNPNAIEYLNSEIESVFIDATTKARVNGIEKEGTQGIVMKNINIVCGESFDNYFDINHSENTIAIKVSNNLNVQNCRIMHFNVCFLKGHTIYSNISNVHAYAITSFIKWIRASIWDTTSTVNNCQISLAKNVIDTFPFSKHYTRTPIYDLRLNNLTIQGCNRFINYWDNAISYLNINNTYYESNQTENSYLIEIKISDCFSNSNEYISSSSIIIENDIFQENKYLYAQNGNIILRNSSYAQSKDFIYINESIKNKVRLSILNCLTHGTKNIISKESNFSNTFWDRFIYMPNTLIPDNTNYMLYLKNIMFNENINDINGYLIKKHNNKLVIEHDNNIDCCIGNNNLSIGLDNTLNIPNSLGLPLLAESIQSSTNGHEIKGAYLKTILDYKKNPILVISDSANGILKNIRNNIIHIIKNAYLETSNDIPNIQELLKYKEYFYNIFYDNKLHELLTFNTYSLNKIEQCDYRINHIVDSLPDIKVPEGFLLYNKKDNYLYITTKSGKYKSYTIRFNITYPFSGNINIKYNIEDNIYIINNANNESDIIDAINKNIKDKFYIYYNNNNIILKFNYLEDASITIEGVESNIIVNNNVEKNEYKRIIPINIVNNGTTQQRPTDVKAGFYYFDTTLNKPIWKKDDITNIWIDAMGAEV